MIYQQQLPQPYPQPLQVVAQVINPVSILLTLALGAWVISQMVKAFRGKEVERPF